MKFSRRWVSGSYGKNGDLLIGTAITDINVWRRSESQFMFLTISFNRLWSDVDSADRT